MKNSKVIAAICGVSAFAAVVFGMCYFVKHMFDSIGLYTDDMLESDEF